MKDTWNALHETHTVEDMHRFEILVVHTLFNDHKTAEATLKRVFLLLEADHHVLHLIESAHVISKFYVSAPVRVVHKDVEFIVSIFLQGGGCLKLSES
jgi:hypothetical protein